MRKKIVYLLLFWWITPTLAVYEDLTTGARAQGMGGAYTAVAYGTQSVHFNPAGLVQLDDLETDITYKYLYSGLNRNLHNANLGIAKKLTPGALAFTLQDIGANLKGEYSGRYSETSLTFSFAYPIGEDIGLGSNLNLYYLQMPYYGSTSALGLDLGILAKVYRVWKLGFFIQNLNQPQIQGKLKSYRLPHFLAFGLAFDNSPTTTIGLDIRKEQVFPTRLALGGEVYPTKNWGVRLGFVKEGELTKFSFGTDFKFSRLNFAYTIIVDPNFPLTHLVTFSFRR